MGEYFRLRRLLETRRYDQLNKARLDRLRDLSQRFQRSAAESRFQDWWQAVAAMEGGVQLDARFEAHRLPYSYGIFGTTSSPSPTA